MLHEPSFNRLWIALIVALPAASPKPLNTPKFVFGTFTNGAYFLNSLLTSLMRNLLCILVNKAWDNNVFAFLLTFIGPFWALGKLIN